MTSFEYFSIALSFVLGLGITRLLVGALGVFRARRRQKVHWIPIVWATGIFILQIQFWWAIFELQGQIEIWTHGVFGTLLLGAILLFIAGALVFPASADQERSSLFEYFEEDGRWALLTLAAYSVQSMWMNWFLFDTSAISVSGAWLVVFGGFVVAAFLSSNRRLLGIFTAAYLLIVIYAYFTFSPAQYAT
jgi:hypothetical protein